MEALRLRSAICAAAFGLLLSADAPGAARPRLAPPHDPQAEPGASAPRAEPGRRRFRIGLEVKGRLRSSEGSRFPVPFPFPPEQLPAGQSRAFVETVEEGRHLELSTVTVTADAAWGERVAARLKIDAVDLDDRNPTSTDREVDVDEAWIRVGREAAPAALPDRPGAYLKVGKIPKFERQDDRHLESYGLVATAFNRFEDLGIEAGADLGRHAYLKVSATQGNPVFLRDPNALAGDNGTPERFRPHPDPDLESGIVVLYDAEVEGLDPDEPEIGAGAGVRFASPSGRAAADLLVWGFRRSLADEVDLGGTRYGGDLDLLRGPFDAFPFPISGRRKEERGANLWLYLGGFSLFAQYADQEIAGLDRTGAELEAAWSVELPLVWALGGRQVFPHVAPAARWSELDNRFDAPAITPAPSLAWDWEKVDLGVRLGIVAGLDLTVELADNRFVLRSGRTASNDERLVTLRWRR